MSGVQYVKTKSGNVFVLTELGAEQAHIRSKYVDLKTTQYLHTVPKSWVEKGFVEEVKDYGAE